MVVFVHPADFNICQYLISSNMSQLYHNIISYVHEINKYLKSVLCDMSNSDRDQSELNEVNKLGSTKLKCTSAKPCLGNDQERERTHHPVGSVPMGRTQYTENTVLYGKAKTPNFCLFVSNTCPIYKTAWQ